MLFDKAQRLVGLLATLQIPHMTTAATGTGYAPSDEWDGDLFYKTAFSANISDDTGAKPIPAWEGGGEVYFDVASNITKHALANQCYGKTNYDTGNSTDPPGMELTFYNGPAFPGHGTTCELPGYMVPQVLFNDIGQCATEMHRHNVIAGCCIIVLLHPDRNRTVTQHDIWSQHVKFSTSPHKYPSDAIECQGWKHFLAHP